MDFNFENKTISEVYDLTLNGFETAFNTRFRLLPKSFIRVTCKVIAGLYITLYKMGAWIFLQQFPSTASYGTFKVLGKEVNPLIEHGNQIGCGKPYEATTFAGKIKISVLDDGILNSGTQLKSSLNGKLYLVTTTKAILLSDGAVQEVDIECTESGTVGNLNNGDELKFVNPLGFLGDTAEISDITTEATDGESVESYRHRVVNRWRTQPQGGALADYRAWGNEVPGVYQIYPYTDDNSAAGVILYVCADKEATGSRVADSAMLKAVGKSCTYDPETGMATRKPLTAVLDPDFDESYTNIKTITEEIFDVYITGYNGDIDSMKDTVKTNIENYLLEREPYIRGLSVDNNRMDDISVNNLIGIVNEIAIANTASFTGVSLYHASESIAAYQLGRGELAKLGTLYINGVAV